ncbi:MAG: hypothetical protein ACRDUY_08110 [Nitriliruptorales bacterium]
MGVPVTHAEALARLEGETFRLIATWEALALNAHVVPPVTRYVQPLPRLGRLACWALFSAWLAYHWHIAGGER